MMVDRIGKYGPDLPADNFRSPAPWPFRLVDGIYGETHTGIGLALGILGGLCGLVAAVAPVGPDVSKWLVGATLVLLGVPSRHSNRNHLGCRRQWALVFVGMRVEPRPGLQRLK